MCTKDHVLNHKGNVNKCQIINNLESMLSEQNADTICNNNMSRAFQMTQ